MPRRLFLLAFLLASTSCDDDPTTPDNTTTTTAPASSARGSLRGAQLVEDQRTVDLVVNGQMVGASIPYAGVGERVELDAGQYRVQFFPAGDRTRVIIEDQMTIGSGQALTAALAGFDAEILIFEDEQSTRDDRARVRLVNAVPDFPAPFDLAIENGPLVVGNVGYTQASSYTELIPGGYNLVLRRASSTEEVATLAGQSLSTGSNYSVFAVGSLGRGEIELFVARDN